MHRAKILVLTMAYAGGEARWSEKAATLRSKLLPCTLIMPGEWNEGTDDAFIALRSIHTTSISGLARPNPRCRTHANQTRTLKHSELSCAPVLLCLWCITGKGIGWARRWS
ncbi:hypothetical protein FRC08_008077 [Ceratobasidium sp. 394]|nr:hypothetical protein FRC08_008077 [Ceratobasidium sp. 394]KAG9101842.1 hypothetical protein FS749_002736 [Ceratobasidium sp. UAMH 11750]